MNVLNKRIPAVPSLSTKLPKGTEGGKEFARIVDLLLFHEARQRGEKFSAINDASGDYSGLDSFGGGDFRRSGRVGYQYKFYPSPLSDNHRHEIEQSLKVGVKAYSKSNIKTWVLVTPDDLTETSTRKNGGDVSWFESLREKVGAPFDLEHLGHTKLNYLFLNCPLICLYYYPELVHLGHSRKQSIMDTRNRYDANLREIFGKIEFIGMSVYKEEAAKGVPLEHIYVPLAAVAEDANDENEDAPRSNPLDFLTPGTKHIIIGDPGSGKSTLLSYLSLVGISPSLQARCNGKSDDRLPILVTLRRYADELKLQRNLSLIDFILESCLADFSLKSANLDFFEFYLEAGKAILLFDGLDELPNSQYKKLIRDRINALATTYPRNTVIVTSRIIGYEKNLRFSSKEYRHHKLAKLRVSDIKNFINDWYSVRVENESDRNMNSRDLIRIVEQPENFAIRDLARNPLLLTIIALVHRIDAVLPDERVILYQKCTETLLNTWHKWKYRDEEEQNKGRIERHNRRRIEAIAHWMQLRSSSTKHGRAVVPATELSEFLTKFISENETIKLEETSAIDLADEFLNFVKRRTGLLIEVGDGQYSFIHLTFQEYLAATYLITAGERDGVGTIWSSLKKHHADPKWREVIRLLIASLKSNESQYYFIDQLLSAPSSDGTSLVSSLLIGGLLLDGIEPAEERAAQIVERLIQACFDAESAEDIRLLVSIFGPWLRKEQGNSDLAEQIFAKLNNHLNKEAKLPLALTGVALGLAPPKTRKGWGRPAAQDMSPRHLFDVLIMGISGVPVRFERHWNDFWHLHALGAMTSSSSNLIAAAAQAVMIRADGLNAAQRMFELQLTVTASSGAGPYEDLFFNTLAIARSASNSVFGEWESFLAHIRVTANENMHISAKTDTSSARKLLLTSALESVAINLKLDQKAESNNHAMFTSVRQRLGQNLTIVRPGSLRMSNLHLPETGELSSLVDELHRTLIEGSHTFWPAIEADRRLVDNLLNSIFSAFELVPDTHWAAAFAVDFAHEVPSLLSSYLNPTSWEELIGRFKNTQLMPSDEYWAGWLILLDAWLWIRTGSKEIMPELSRLAEATRDSHHAALVISHCIRDISLGNEDAVKSFHALLAKKDPNIRREFVKAYWITR